MPAFCQHTRKPLQSLETRFKAFRGLDHAQDYFISQEGVIYYSRAASVDYGRDYFLEEYSRQYGKSYLEDEANLRTMARGRLQWLEQVAPVRKGSILEIGCAAGFFLSEAREKGFSTTGIEISSYAGDLAAQQGHRIFRESFLSSAIPELLQGESGFDLIASFYTIEHFADQQTAFKRMAKYLKPGGLLLVAMPSYHGPLFYCSPGRWIATHPGDHFADYSPEALRAILPIYGLRLLAARPASYHQNRSCGWRASIPSFLYRKMAQRQGYGDTMEFIAIRDP